MIKFFFSVLFFCFANISFAQQVKNSLNLKVGLLTKYSVFSPNFKFAIGNNVPKLSGLFGMGGTTRLCYQRNKIAISLGVRHFGNSYNLFINYKDDSLKYDYRFRSKISSLEIPLNIEYQINKNSTISVGVFRSFNELVLQGRGKNFNNKYMSPIIISDSAKQNFEIFNATGVNVCFSKTLKKYEISAGYSMFFRKLPTLFYKTDIYKNQKLIFESKNIIEPQTGIFYFNFSRNIKLWAN